MCEQREVARHEAQRLLVFTHSLGGIHLTTVKKVSQRGWLAAAIMLPLILFFYSLPDAQAAEVIRCGQDIDDRINADSRSTATTFELEAGCTFVASAPIVPSNGDVVRCNKEPTFEEVAPETHTPLGNRGPAYDPTTFCTVAGPSVENVFRPQGQGGSNATVRFEGIRITGGNFTGSSGSGAGIAEGSMTDASSHYGIEVMNNGAAGILSAKGTFDSVEFTNNTREPNALGVIAAGMKARNEVEVKDSYIHDTQGNGLWCDNFCHDSDSHPNGFWVHDNLVVNNGRSGIRFEEVGGVFTAGEALIENNEVHDNSLDADRGGISVRDAQDATIQNNRFGAATIGGVAYLPNSRDVAITASDSGRSDRPNLSNIAVVNNALNGETVKGCELPNTVVDCAGDTPWCANIVDHAYELLRTYLLRR
jgi:hypothetical protein